GRARAAFIRVNYGLQRHGGGGMAVRTIACLPAITGHWRRPGGGVQLSTSANFTFDRAAVERPDLSPPVRTINMIRLGEALTRPDAGVGGPPVRALVVYNSNPAAVAPDRSAVLEGLARRDLFTVVLEHFQTDTADWADIVLPATTQLEHWDLHLAYGHHYVALNRPSIAPVGEAKPNSEIFRRIAARMGLDHPVLRDDDQTLIRQALDGGGRNLEGVTFDALVERGWMRLSVPRPYLPFAQGGFPTPSGRCEFYSERLAEMGLDPLPTYTPPYESVERAPELAGRYPLTLISSPAHQFLNSTFVNIDVLRRAAREPELVIHPADAAPRAIVPGSRVLVHNDRGEFLAVARVEDSVREGAAFHGATLVARSRRHGEGRVVSSRNAGRAQALHLCIVPPRHALRQGRSARQLAPPPDIARTHLPWRPRLRRNRRAANRQRAALTTQLHPARPARPGEVPHPALARHAAR